MLSRIKYIVIVLCAMYSSVVMAFSGGSGTSSDPYIISTPSDFTGINSQLNKSFKQVNDIDLSSSSVIYNHSAFDNTSYIGSFYGVYDGGGHKINIKDTLFISNSGTIKDLVITGDVKKANISSALCEGNNGTLLEIKNYADVTALSSYHEGNDTAAGLVCSSSGVIKYCANYGKISAPGTATGIVDTFWNGTISETYNSGDITSQNGMASAITCWASNCSMNNIYNCGKIEGLSNGLVFGPNSGSVIIQNCYNVDSIRTFNNTNMIAKYPNIIGDMADGPKYVIVNNCYTKDEINDTFMKSQQLVDLLNNTQNPIVWKPGGYDYSYPKLIGYIQLNLYTNHTKIGDNTKIPLTILYKGSIKKLEVYIDDTRVYSGDVTNNIDVTTSNEGSLNVYVKGYDETGVLLYTSNKINIDKRNVLNSLLDVLNEHNNNKVAIVSDSNRYYENNELNKEIIENITQLENGVYLIGDMLPESKELLSRLTK